MADHARGGVCEEAGELSTVIKRHVVYNKAPDIPNIIEELGDLRFFIQATMGLYGISEQQILQHNACKLEERYEQLMFTEEAARARKDKSGEGREES
jgi:NTP pyrophosphatase (non-canonical NTP hydrolase)